MERDYAMLACGATQIDVWLAFLAGLTLAPLIPAAGRWWRDRRTRTSSQP